MQTDPHSSLDQKTPRWVQVVWLLMLVWSVYVIARAHGELSGQRDIQGLFRSYSAPYIQSGNWIVDPKMTRLDDELNARFNIHLPTRDIQNLSPEAWCRLLKRAGTQCRMNSAKQPHKDVIHLRFIRGAQLPELWLGRLGIKHVTFTPDVGVVVRETLDPADTTLSLPDLREKPW